MIIVGLNFIRLFPNWYMYNKCITHMHYFLKMPFECFQEVANDLEKLLEDDEGYDVIIYAGENENVKAIHAHSNILRTRSQYFRAAFSNEWAEKKDGKFIFKKPNISPQTFNIILR